MAAILIAHRLFSHHFNIPYSYVMMSGLFMGGTAMTMLGAINWQRRTYLGSGLPMILLGMAIPFLNSWQDRYIAVGIFFIMVGSIVAIIMSCQLKKSIK